MYKFFEKAPTVTIAETASTKAMTSSASIAVSLSRASSPTIIATTSTTSRSMKAWRKEEEDKKGKLKKYSFSKQVGFVLERENKFFLRRK